MKKYSIAIVGIIVVAVIFVSIHLFSKSKSDNIYKLELDTNSKTGYLWSYDLSVDGIVQVVTDNYIERGSEEGTVDVDGTQIYEFKGVSEGEVDVVLTYQQVGGDDIAEEKTITLVVDKKLNIKEKTDN